MRKLKPKIALTLLLCVAFLSMTFFVNIPTAKAQTTIIKTYYGSTSDVGLISMDTSYNAVRFASSAYDSLSPSAQYALIGQTHPNAGQYLTYRSCFVFDTADIPSTALITSAIVSLNVMVDQSTTDFDVVLSGTSTYPHNPPQLGDYYFGWYPDYFGSESSSGFVVGEYFNMSLSANGLEHINLNGYTNFLAWSSRDINGDEPAQDGTPQELVQVATGDNAKKPMLTVTYVVLGEGEYSYTLNGPYTDDGQVYDGTARITVFPQDSPSFTVDLVADGSFPDQYNLTVSSRPVSLVWNISTSGNYSRVIYFTDLTPEELFITMPTTDKPFYLYTFTVNDFFGVSNGYLESMLYINGSNRVIERQRIDAINNLPFYMTWGTTYNMRVVCDNGTLSTGTFTALSDQTPVVVIPFGSFQGTDNYRRVSANAIRNNASSVTITYNDADFKTLNLKIEVEYWNGTAYAVIFTETVPTQSYSYTWENGLGRVNYVVNITAYRTEGTLNWFKPCPFRETQTNIFAPLNSLGDGLPMEVQYIPAVIIIICALISFSTWHISAGVWIAWGAAAFCTLVGWLPNTGTPTVVGLGIAAIICAGITIGEFKKGERTL